MRQRATRVDGIGYQGWVLLPFAVLKNAAVRLQIAEMKTMEP